MSIPLLKVIYRISDKGREKEKIANAGKFSCIENAINEFGLNNIYVLADNCSRNTIDFMKKIGIEYEETSLGNIKSFLYIVNLSIEKYDSDTAIYFLEDDYLHLPGSRKLILEGLGIADYVTLYDHPDKYWNANEGGNPFNYNGPQLSQVFLTKNSHWKTINSTPMTFATTIKILKEDYSIWNNQPQRGVTDSFLNFVILTKQTNFKDVLGVKKYTGKVALQIFKNNFSFRKKRVLISPIPSKSTHTEINYLAPLIDWSKIPEENKEKTSLNLLDV